MRASLRKFLVPILALVAHAAIAQDFTQEKKDAVLKGIEEIVTQRAYNPGTDFTKWPGYIQAKKEAIDASKDENEFARIINNSLREFGLSHLRLQTPRVAARRGQTSAVGTGAAVTKSEEGLQVRGLAESGPAKAAGLEVGDVIVKVNGQKAADPTVLEGESGKKIQVEVKKANGEIKPVEIEVKQFSTVRKESLTWLNDDTAIIKVVTFSAGYDQVNLNNLVREANTKAKALVLDLRSNGGGQVNNLNHLLSLLMPDKTVYGTFISRRTADDFTKANPDKTVTAEAVAAWAPNKTATRERTVKPFKGKIVVLTNRGSGSASEICAQSLREGVGAKIVGTKTAGAVLASVFGRLPEGFSLQYPVSDFVTAKGMRIEKNPVVPDFEVSATRSEDGKDPVVEKAIEVIQSM